MGVNVHLQFVLQNHLCDLFDDGWLAEAEHV